MTDTRILVVEDEVNIRLFLNETLSSDGYQVTTADSGEAALALIADQEFDLALLDLVLGGISGMEVLAALRQHSPNTVVILLTAHATLDTAVEALRLGAYDYLYKPCKTAQLRESIRQGLAKRERELRQRSLLHHLERHLTDELDNIRATMAGDMTKVPPTPAPAPPPVPVPPPAGPDDYLIRGKLVVNFTQHTISLDGQMLDVSLTEFDLLTYLIREAPRVISPQELIREIQGYATDVWEARDMVRQHVYNIRQKIKDATGQTEVIRTVRGVGYTIEN